MPTITLDPHDFMRRLRDAGMAEPLVEAQVATKSDIRDLAFKLARLESNLTIKLAVLLAVTMGAVAAIAKLL